MSSKGAINSKHVPVIRHTAYIVPADDSTDGRDAYRFALLTVGSDFRVQYKDFTGQRESWTLKQCNDYMQDLKLLHKSLDEKFSILVNFTRLNRGKVTLRGYWAGWDDKLNVMLFTRDEVITE